MILINMEMPKNCHECAFGKYEVCGINAAIEGDNTVTNSCPLIEVPPHGRLIDADALDVQFGWLAEAEGYKTHISFVYSNDIDNAPTVIPADKVGET